MTPTEWKEIGAVVALIVVGGYNAWQARGARKSADQANHNVTQNGGSNNPPTVPDRLCEIRGELGELRGELMGAIGEVREQGQQTHDLMVEHLADHAGSDLSR